MFLFQEAKAHNMLCMMLNLRYKTLGLVIHFIGKGETLQFVGEYDCQVLLPLLVSTYNFLNPSDVSAKAPTFTSQNIETISLYDFMEIDEKMKSSTVNEQLNHFKVKKFIEEEVKNALQWWKVHEVQFVCWVCSLTNSRDC